ncbi:MAG TPA: acyl-CoA carboxylase epsilon subunit [Mycobacteriales bacterium]|nr:acyl-CoA carboxylase epsilon subunit [Mycobacteriales bacterium]
MRLDVSGSPTAEELAAVVAVLTAASATAVADAEPAATSRWSDRAALLRRALPTGPDAWRAAR